jgi:CheY-like chemotaxis protein
MDSCQAEPPAAGAGQLDLEQAEPNPDRVIAKLLHDLQNSLWPAAVQAEVAAVEVDCPANIRAMLEQIGSGIREGMTIVSRMSEAFKDGVSVCPPREPAPADRSGASLIESGMTMPAPSAHSQAAYGPQSAAGRMRILCVDNDPNIRGVLARSLNHLGHEVELCRSGSAALAVFVNGRYDLVMTDLEMPGMDGRAVTREIRARSQTPVIWVTGQNLSAESESLHRSGSPDLVLPKPLSLNSLRRALAVVFGVLANRPAIDQDAVDPYGFVPSV